MGQVFYHLDQSETQHKDFIQHSTDGTKNEEEPKDIQTCLDETQNLFNHRWPWQTPR